jgi:hypothetical protein
MATGTPATTLLVEYIATQLALLQPPAYRTSIGANVSTERPQALDSDAPFVSVRLVGWESGEDPVPVMRSCELRVEACVPATDDNAEDQARDAAEDLYELFRVPGASVTLSANAYALIRAVSSADIDRPDGGASVIAGITLRADLYDT